MSYCINGLKRSETRMSYWCKLTDLARKCCRGETNRTFKHFFVRIRFIVVKLSLMSFDVFLLME